VGEFGGVGWDDGQVGDRRNRESLCSNWGKTRVAPPTGTSRSARLKLETLMLLSGTGLPRRHGGVTPRSDTTFSRAPDSARKARLEFILPVRERNAGFLHVSGLFEMTPMPLAHT